jgi:hypothetical protein
VPGGLMSCRCWEFVSADVPVGSTGESKGCDRTKRDSEATEDLHALSSFVHSFGPTWGICLNYRATPVRATRGTIGVHQQPYD